MSEVTHWRTYEDVCACGMPWPCFSAPVTITISRESAEDLVADERYIKERTMVELEYAALAALGRDE